ncbi:MAG: hypothetical protein KIT16_04030 [Rhodospirillaceae bacterium]|nr:hypothetical protein [Rhodospirillaceae bacterium]
MRWLAAGRRPANIGSIPTRIPRSISARCSCSASRSAAANRKLIRRCPMNLRRLLRLSLFVFALAAGLAAAQAQSPFGRGAPTAPSGAEAAPKGAEAANPGLMRRWYAMLLRWQGEMTQQMATEVRAYKDKGALEPVLGILLISFVYGVAHAVGPGHGKTASAAYFGANRAQAIHGISMSALIGLVQALSAIAFVGAFALLFKVSQTQTVRGVVYVEVASYALIAAVGLWIAWGGVIGRGCTHDHGLGAHRHDHGHDHAHGHGHGHDHHHHHGHAHAVPAAPAAAISLRSMLPVALASGLRPCTGAVLILLFTLTQGIFEIGVLATVVMSFGTFLVVALIGLGVIYARRAASRAGGRNERLANLAQRAISFGGGLIVFFFGGIFLLNALQQLGVTI